MSLVRLLGFTTSGLRMRRRPVSRSGHQSRSHLRGGKRPFVRQPWPSPESHDRRGALRRRLADRRVEPGQQSVLNAGRVTARPQRCASRFSSPTLATNVLVSPRRHYGVSVILKPHKILKTGQSREPLLPRRLPRRLQAARAAQRRRHRHLAALQHRDPVQPLPGRAVAGRLPGVDRRVGCGGDARASAGRLAVPERRRQAERSRGPRSTSCRRRARISSCRTSFTGSSRSPSTSASAGAAAGLTRDLAVGHYKPINSDRFLNDCHEFIFHLTPHGATSLDRLALGVPYQDQSNIARWRGASGGVRCRGNTWFIPYETIQQRDRDRPHPATFPTRLPEQCLRLHGLDRIQVAMDPFTGLGSTAVACARLGVSFIGSRSGRGLPECGDRARAAMRASRRWRRRTQRPGEREGRERQNGRKAG